jgi:hypothetical protein
MIIYDDLWWSMDVLQWFTYCFNGDFHSKQLSNRRRYPLLASSKGHGVSTICRLSHLWMDELLISTFFPPFFEKLQKNKKSVVHPFKKTRVFLISTFSIHPIFFWKLSGIPWMKRSDGPPGSMDGSCGDDSPKNKERQKWGWWLPPIYD